MLEPIKESTRERRMERALLVLEGLTIESDGGIASSVYRIAHAALGTCCCGGHGDPWLAEIEQAERELIAAIFVDVERLLRA